MINRVAQVKRGNVFFLIYINIRLKQTVKQHESSHPHVVEARNQLRAI